MMVSSTIFIAYLTTAVLSWQAPRVHSTAFHPRNNHEFALLVQRGGGGDDTPPRQPPREMEQDTTTMNPSKPPPPPPHDQFELIHVQIIHRHGDRTPITPLSDVEFWKNTLPHPTLLEKIAHGTNVERNDGPDKCISSHAAAGIGPFGKLTQLGLLQMVQVGSQLLEELQYLDQDVEENDGRTRMQKGYLFTKNNPIHPSKIKVISTDFPRTLQSVQAVLVGLFPDGFRDLDNDISIKIDSRYTSELIPDPQPRLSNEQVQLEIELSQRPHLQERENELQDLALKLTHKLSHLIDDSVDALVFGIGEEMEQNGMDGNPLAWIQLVEIMKCLKVRNLLPNTISEEEYEIASAHVAWKWFESLRDERLARLAMKPFMNFIMGELLQVQSRGERGTEKETREDEETLLTIYSCHDSSLIGLISAFRLQQPSKWPE